MSKRKLKHLLYYFILALPLIYCVIGAFMTFRNEGVSYNPETMFSLEFLFQPLSKIGSIIFEGGYGFHPINDFILWIDDEVLGGLYFNLYSGDGQAWGLALLVYFWWVCHVNFAYLCYECVIWIFKFPRMIMEKFTYEN